MLLRLVSYRQPAWHGRTYKWLRCRQHTVPWWITEPLKPRHHLSKSCSISHAVQPTLLHHSVSNYPPASKLFDTHLTACVEILATSLQTRTSVPVTTAECSYKLHIFLSPTNNHADSNLRDLGGHNPRIINRQPNISARTATKVTDGQTMTDIASALCVVLTRSRATEK